MTTYYVTAKRFQRTDGILMTADKRVHTGLSHSEADTLYKSYIRNVNGGTTWDGYWHEARMVAEEDYDAKYQEILDGQGENQTDH